MRTEKLDEIAGTFHDFDLINVYPKGRDLVIEFNCFWNQMNDENNPWMNFEFEFSDASLISYELFKDNSKSKVNVNGEALISRYKPLIEADIYFNQFEYQHPSYFFFCNPNEATYATVEIKFKSDQVKITKDKSEELTIRDYLLLCDRWWKFVEG